MSSLDTREAVREGITNVSVITHAHRLILN